MLKITTALMLVENTVIILKKKKGEPKIKITKPQYATLRADMREHLLLRYFKS